MENKVKVLEFKKEIPYWPYCEECKQPFEFDSNEPFAYCLCGMTEWGYPRPASYVPKPTKRLIISEAEEILDQYYPVLDKGFVALVNYSGGDATVEQAARCSYGAGTRKTSETRGLIRYLMRHYHSSPLEQVSVTFFMGMPIFVARQFIRHRTASVNEYSGRYSLMPMLFYTPDDLRIQSKDNKQGSDGAHSAHILEQAKQQWESNRTNTEETYGWLLGLDVSRELARIDLPLSTYTYWYFNIDLNNLFKLLTLRCDSHAQYEIRVYAEVMAAMVRRVAPLCYEAWIDYQFAGEHFSYQEMDIIRTLLEPYENGIGIRAAEPYGFNSEYMKNQGMNQREITEFINKLKEPENPIPDFELDMSLFKPASYFEEMVKNASGI